MKRMKPSAEAASHLHKRADVDPAKITAFGDASWATQLEVLKWLRLDISADVSQLQYFAVTLLLGFLTLLIAPPEGFDLTGTNWLTSLVLGALLVAFLLLLAVPFLWPLMMDHRDRAVKLVWLAAYEDEIARRQSLISPVVANGAAQVFRRLSDRASAKFRSQVGTWSSRN